MSDYIVFVFQLGLAAVNAVAYFAAGRHWWNLIALAVCCAFALWTLVRSEA